MLLFDEEGENSRRNKKPRVVENSGFLRGADVGNRNFQPVAITGLQPVEKYQPTNMPHFPPRSVIAMYMHKSRFDV